MGSMPRLAPPSRAPSPGEPSPAGGIGGASWLHPGTVRHLKTDPWAGSFTSLSRGTANRGSSASATAEVPGQRVIRGPGRPCWLRPGWGPLVRGVGRARGTGPSRVRFRERPGLRSPEVPSVASRRGGAVGVCGLLAARHHYQSDTWGHAQADSRPRA